MSETKVTEPCHNGMDEFMISVIGEVKGMEKLEIAMKSMNKDKSPFYVPELKVCYCDVLTPSWPHITSLISADGTQETPRIEFILFLVDMKNDESISSLLCSWSALDHTYFTLGRCCLLIHSSHRTCSTVKKKRVEKKGKREEVSGREERGERREESGEEGDNKKGGVSGKREEEIRNGKGIEKEEEFECQRSANKVQTDVKAETATEKNKCSAGKEEEVKMVGEIGEERGDGGIGEEIGHEKIEYTNRIDCAKIWSPSQLMCRGGADGDIQVSDNNYETHGGPREPAGYKGEVNGGLCDVKSGTSEVNGGLGEVMSGTSEVNGGLGEVMSGTSEVNGGAGEVKSGTSEVNGGLGGVKSSTSEIKSGTSEVNGGLGGVKSSTSEIKSGASEVNGGLGEVKSGRSEVNGGLGEVKSGTSQVNGGLGEVNCGRSEVNSGAIEVNCGVDEVKSGTSEVNGGLGEVKSDTSEVNGGLGEVKSGASEVNGGTGQVSAGVRHDESHHALRRVIEQRDASLLNKLSAVPVIYGNIKDSKGRKNVCKYFMPQVYYLFKEKLNGKPKNYDEQDRFEVELGWSELERELRGVLLTATNLQKDVHDPEPLSSTSPVLAHTL